VVILIEASDEQLCQALQRGNHDALDGLVERHHSPLFGYLYRLTDGDRTLVQDLVQETFLRLLRGIASYHDTRPFKPYLYQIATNLARDHYKSAAHRYEAALLEDEQTAAYSFEEHNPTVLEDVVDEQHAVQSIRPALALLPIHQQEAIILRYYQDLSLSEMADVLNIPIGTVKSRLSLGLKALRQIMEAKKPEREMHNG